MTPGCFLKVILSLCCFFPRWDKLVHSADGMFKGRFHRIAVALVSSWFNKRSGYTKYVRLCLIPLWLTSSTVYLPYFMSSKYPKPLRQTTENMSYQFFHFTKETFSSFSSWMPSLREIVRIPGLFAVIIYSSKVIIRHRRRNGRSSAPLLPSPSASHYYNIAALK